MDENEELNDLSQFGMDDVMKAFADAASETESQTSAVQNTIDMTQMLQQILDQAAQQSQLQDEKEQTVLDASSQESPEREEDEGRSVQDTTEPVSSEPQGLLELVRANVGETADRNEEPAVPSQSDTGEHTEEQPHMEASQPEPTRVIPSDGKAAQEKAPVAEKSQGPIPLARSKKLRELKRKLVAGPEKRFYELSEQGVIRLQIRVLLNTILLLVAVAAVVLDFKDRIPDNLSKLMVFGQVFLMLVSGLLGSQIMVDGLSDLFRLHYSANTSLTFAFLACCADAWFCLAYQRIPACAPFILMMEMAMIAAYQRYSVELSQMDTMRKADHLVGIVKEPDYYARRPGILRVEGTVEDFMGTYSRLTGPEVLQGAYSLIACIVSIGIGVIAGVLHDPEYGFKLFAAAMLATLPAGYFIALTRPAAILEKRLHMVGTVLCGWNGIKKLSGRGTFALYESDFFPRGSIKLNGIKYYSERTSAEVVSYASSLMFAAGGNLVPLFRQMLTSRNCTEYEVEDFRDYGNGGVGGVVNGEPVLMGSADFLRDMGVEVPSGCMVSQAMYVSIDGELAGVIAITYAKTRSSDAGLVSLCSSMRLRAVVLVKDFMMTESALREKFGVRSRRLIFPEKAERDALLARTAAEDAQVLALASRDDLISSAYAVTGSMALRSAWRMAGFVCILGGILAALAIGAMAYLGPVDDMLTKHLTPLNVLIYQAIWLIPSLIAEERARKA